MSSRDFKGLKGFLEDFKGLLWFLIDFQVFKGDYGILKNFEGY